MAVEHTSRQPAAQRPVLEYGGPRVVAIVVPWHLTPPKIEDALTKRRACRAVPYSQRPCVCGAASGCKSLI